MARCKCKYCGKALNTSDAYKIEIIGPRNGKTTYKYCCSIEEWQEDEDRKKMSIEEKQRKKTAEEERKEKAKQDKDSAYYLICKIIGRDEIINTRLWSEWKEWNKVASNEKIGRFLVENEAYLTGVIGKLVDAESPRIGYLSAVLKNSLGDYRPKAKEEVEVQPQTEMHFELFEPALNVKAERVILDDVEDDLI